MTTPPVAHTPTGPRAHARPGHTGNGQWAMGYREPLNANEQVKKDDDGLNVRARIETIYAHRGFDSIDPADLRGRLRWWGLYTQRKPGIDGGRTAVLEPEELDDEYFMLRVRIDGGQLTDGAAAGHRRDLHGVRARHRRHHRPAEHPAALDPDRGRAGDLGGAGGRRAVDTTEACGDVPAGHPRLPGRRDRRRRDHRPAPARSRRSSGRYIGSPEFSNLPRKFKTAITGPPLHDVVHEINDIAFVGVEHPEHGPGFDLWVGGGLSTNPLLGRAARRVGRRWTRCPTSGPAWSASSATTATGGCAPRPAEVPGRRLGRRRSSARCSRTSTSSGELLDGPAPELLGRSGRPHRRAPSRRTAGSTSASRRWSAGSPATDPDQARRRGRGARLGPGAHHADQKLLVLDVEAGPGRVAGRRRSTSSASRPGRRLPARHDGLHRHRVLQAGDRGDQGPRGAGWSTELERRLADVGTRSTYRSRSTSTAAPTPAPGSRPPTSASRASS